MSDLSPLRLVTDVLAEYPSRRKAEDSLPAYRKELDKMITRSLGTETGQRLAPYLVGVRKAENGKYQVYLTPRDS